MPTKPVVYVSSTFVDLEDHRAALKAALERARFDVECMEKYAAFDQRPKDKCLEDVAACDFYVLLIAHRYGFVPPADNPCKKSITQLEYEHAVTAGKRPLVFVVDDDHPWPPKVIDKGRAAAKLAAFRSHVQLEHGVSPFTTPDHLAAQVLQALSARAQEAERVASHPTGYRWPAAWDFSAYMAHKGKDFVGRDWLFRDIAAWLAQPAPRALLIRADFGVGKSAIMSDLIRRNPGKVLAGWHFCQHDTQDTLNPIIFVRSLAAQFAATLPGYRALVESEAALQDKLDKAGEDPASAFEAAIVAPLARIEPPGGPRLLVVDALDEALELDETAARRHGNIIRLLADRAGRLTDWLRLLVTSRNNPNVIRPLSTFGLKEIDAENVANQRDLRDYAMLRCMREPLATRLREVGRSADDIADILRDKSLGKFLYTIRALDDLESGNINPDDLAGLPPGMDSFYLDAFERRFARTGRDYGEVRRLLGVLALAKEPLPIATLVEILDESEQSLQSMRRLLPDFIRLRGNLWAFDHFSLAEWLTGSDDDGFARAGDYAVDARDAAERFHAWALRRVREQTAHESAYLVRHLAAHLVGASERRAVFAKLMLGSYEWLAERLLLAGAGALIADCDHLDDLPQAPLLRALFRACAHVLRRHPDQLPAQLLGRIRSLRQTTGPLSELLTATWTWLNSKPKLPNSQFMLLPQSASLGIFDSLLACLDGHFGPVTALALLPDGRLASGSRDGSVCLWDLDTARETQILLGHAESVEALVVLLDGRLASGSRDNTIWIWDPDGAREPVVLEGHEGQVQALAALPDGRLASASKDNTIRIWDVIGAREPLALTGHSDAVYSLVALRNGRVASASKDGTVRIWNIANEHLSRVIVVGESWHNCGLVSLPDGRIAAATGMGTYSILIWDPEGNREDVTLKGHTLFITALAVLADGRLASASWDRTVRIWDANGILESKVFAGHTDVVLVLAALPDGRVASASRDHTVRIWDPQGLREPVSLSGHSGSVKALTVLPGRRLASASDDRTVRVWAFDCGQQSAAPEGHSDTIRALAAINSKHVASASDDHTVRIWDASGVHEPRVLEGHTDQVRAVAVLHDGRLASASYDGSLRVWDLHKASEPGVLVQRGGLIDALAVLPNGSLAAASNHRNLLIWGPDCKGEPKILKGGHSSLITEIAALADGRIASASDDCTVRIWEQEGARKPRVLKGHDGMVSKLAVLPNGLIASSSWDGTIRIWNPDKNRALRVLRGHDGPVEALALLSDGSLASASWDATVRIWDPECGREIRVLGGHTAKVRALAVLSGHRLAAGSNDNTVRIWDLRDGRLLALFVADGAVELLAPIGSDMIAVADATNALHFLKLYQ